MNQILGFSRRSATITMVPSVTVGSATPLPWPLSVDECSGDDARRAMLCLVLPVHNIGLDNQWPRNTAECYEK